MNVDVAADISNFTDGTAQAGAIADETFGRIRARSAAFEGMAAKSLQSDGQTPISGPIDSLRVLGTLPSLQRAPDLHPETPPISDPPRDPARRHHLRHGKRHYDDRHRKMV
ncbi:MAG: hypothetical protein WCF13_01550 [Stellaceae bacterium]